MTIAKPNYRQVAGFAGSVTKSGAVINSFNADTEIAEGLPVKLASGKIVEMATGDKAHQCVGIVAKRAPFATFDAGQLLAVVHEGFVQVPMTEGETPARGGQVYFDPDTHKFTTTSASKVPVRAIWAADGQADGLAEIQVVPHIAPGA